MDKSKLQKYVELEVQWLRYYTHVDSRMALHFDDIKFYDRLVSIGYTKRVIPLDRRCMPTVITSDKDALTDDLNSLRECADNRDHGKNAYSPLEVWVSRFPDECDWVLKKMKD